MSTSGERFFDEPDAEALQAENEQLRQQLAEARAAAVAVPPAVLPAGVAADPHRAAMLAAPDWDSFLAANLAREEAARRTEPKPIPSREDVGKAMERARGADEATFWSEMRSTGAVDDSNGTYMPADPDHWGRQ